MSFRFARYYTIIAALALLAGLALWRYAALALAFAEAPRAGYQAASAGLVRGWSEEPQSEIPARITLSNGAFFL